LITPVGTTAALALIAAYVLFLLAATGWLALRDSWRLAPLFPVIIAAIHFCWGFGVWAGLLRGKVPGLPPRLEPKAHADCQS
jgi:ABC-type polysaccharide/polyol phosphate export permease